MIHRIVVRVFDPAGRCVFFQDADIEEWYAERTENGWDLFWAPPDRKAPLGEDPTTHRIRELEDELRMLEWQKDGMGQRICPDCYGSARHADNCSLARVLYGKKEA